MKATFLDDAGVTGRKQSSDQPILLLGGIILDIDRMPDVHQRFDEIVARTFNSISGASIPETHARPEIHARPIVSGKRPFGSLTMDERLKISEDVYDLISEYDGHVCCFAFLKENYTICRDHPYHIAFSDSM